MRERHNSDTSREGRRVYNEGALPVLKLTFRSTVGFTSMRLAQPIPLTEVSEDVEIL